jgi:hypothetical protein
MNDRGDQAEDVVEIRGERLTPADARELSTVLLSAAEDLEQHDRSGTIVMRDDRRELFNGSPLTATDCRQLAARLNAAVTRADEAARSAGSG